MYKKVRRTGNEAKIYRHRHDVFRGIIAVADTVKAASRAAAMSLSPVCVVTNALRLRFLVRASSPGGKSKPAEILPLK